MLTRTQAEGELAAHGQQHLLRHFDELTADGQRQLLTQISALDLGWLERSLSTPASRTAPERIAPYPDTIGPDTAGAESARAAGQQALRAGRVATLLVAGGQGTRLGFDGPKGCFPFGPVSGRTLFQIVVDQLLAVGRRYGVTPPLYLMTSPANHQQTIDLFAAHDDFGLPAERLVIFEQGQAPVVDASGKLLLAAPDRLALSPDGNGGVFAALRSAGAFAHMRALGVEAINYVQIDNPLARVCEPLFVGYHVQRDSEFSCKAIRKTDPFERVGNYALVDGKLGIVEYFEIPDELATRRGDDGQLLFGYGNPGIFIWSRAFAERQATRELPVHRAHKKVAHVDEHGQPVTPDAPNAYKLEMFALDTLDDARSALLLACARDEEFAPVKNATGRDSPDSARSLMTSLHRRWLEKAGATVADETTVEISPCFALDGAELAERLPTGTHIERDTFLTGC